MKVEIISSHDINDVQAKINGFTEGNDVISVTVTPTWMHDLYEDRAPEVCNQWIQYTAVVIIK